MGEVKMGYFNGIDVNDNITLKEGTDKIWSFSLNQTAPVSLFVGYIDGYGMDIYVMSSDEYSNYSRGKSFRYITGLGYENIDNFENIVDVPAGSYYLVARLQKIQEGMDSYAVAAVRCETLE